MEFQTHQMEFTTPELAAIVACVLTALSEAPEDAGPMEQSLVLVVEKITKELGLTPISIPDPVHIA